MFGGGSAWQMLRYICDMFVSSSSLRCSHLFAASKAAVAQAGFHFIHSLSHLISSSALISLH